MEQQPMKTYTQNTTHTPGRVSQPWELWPDYTAQEICVGTLQPHSNLVCAAAIVPYTDKEEGFEVARLIAAAPELLTELEKLAAFAAQHTGNGCNEAEGAILDKMQANGEQLASTVNAARAAIAKAKGQQ